jgi:thioredoxin 1
MKEVTKEEFLALQEKNENIMIDVWANWCQPCKILKPILNNIDVPTNVNLISLDFDQNKEFVSTLNVRSLPTVILFKGNKEINRIIGLKTQNDYQTQIKQLSEE